MGSANADSTWQTYNGHVVGNTVQFDWRGGTATYAMTVPDGSTIAVAINNTIANCIGNCTPIADEWRVSINGQLFSGNAIEQTTVTAVVSGEVIVSVYGKDIGFWGGWYGPIFSAPVIQDTLISIVETQTPQVVETGTVANESQTVVNNPSSESQTPVLDTVTVDTQTLTSDSPTVVVLDTSVVIVEAPTSLETLTSSETLSPVETATPVVETGTAPVEQLPLPTPVPVVEPQPVPQPVPVVVEPQPEPQPQPEPEPLPEVINEETPSEEQPLEETPVVEEQSPVEEPSELPAEEETNESPIEEPVIQEPLEPTPEPSPRPIVEPEPVTQPDVAYEPPTVVLDNGVILTQEVAAAVVLLQNPTELLTELFTDPGAVLTALGSVGADMTPEVREKSEKVVVSAIIAGGIATQSAAAAAGAAAYRRKQ